MRIEYFISREHEWQVLQKVMQSVDYNYDDLDATNTLVINVSPDYSSTVAMHLAHHLSNEGEMCDIITLDVPYPDQDMLPYFLKAKSDLHRLPRTYENYLFVEAAIIRGSNYSWISNLYKDRVPGKIITVALFENKESKFKSDIVGEYYDDATQDLTFYYERYNKHWNG